MSSLYSLYTDAELADLIAQVKAAIPRVMRGQRVHVGDSETEYASLESLKAFGDALARERDSRSGRDSRVVACRPRRDPFGRGW